MKFELMEGYKLIGNGANCSAVVLGLTVGALLGFNAGTVSDVISPIAEQQNKELGCCAEL